MPGARRFDALAVVSTASTPRHVVLGNLRDPESLRVACGDDSPENVDLNGNQNLIAAARTAGVGTFVFVSTLGASPESPIPTFRAKAAAEKSLQESGMRWTVLQPTAFMDVWFPMMIEAPAFSGQPVTLVGESRRRHSFIAEQDVAAFAVAALDNPAARNATLVIGGPEPVTFRDVVHAYEEAAGRPIPVRSVSPGEPIPGLPEPVWGIAAALETFDSPVPMEETARRFGVTLTSPRAFARTRVPAASTSSPGRSGP